MIIDAFNELSDAQAVTSTAISTKVYDLGPVTDNTTRDIGVGTNLYMFVRTNTACTDTSSDATLTVTIESDSDTNLSTSVTTHASTGALAFATFSPAGTVLYNGPLPSGSYERYLGVRYTVASGPLTAGAFDAFITHDVDAYRAYAKRWSIAASA